MADILDKASEEDIKAELERRASENEGGGVSAFLKRLYKDYIPNTAKGALKGASAGATSLLTFPADLAASVANLVTDVPIPGEEIKKALGTAEQPSNGIERAAYNFSEGALPSAALGMLGGPGAAVVAGTVGGVLNMTGKTFFPNSPMMQAVTNMAPLGVSALRQAGRAIMPPATPKMQQDPVTGVHLTPGQTSGNLETLSKEEALRRGVKTSPLATQAYKAQDQGITSFFNTIQKTSGKIDTNPETLIPTVYKAFEAKDSSLIDSFKTANRQNFTAAERAGGGKAVIPTDNVLSKVDELIARFDNPEVPQMAGVSSAWKRVKAAYLEDVPAGAILGINGQPMIAASKKQNNITVERLQQNLAAWADAAKNGQYTPPGKAGNLFEGVAPGQVKGMARQVLNAYRADMDQAIAVGAPGAAQLKHARDQFKVGLEGINSWAGHPVVKHFSVENLSNLHPEQTYKMLSELENSQRVQAMAAIKTYDPDAWESIRVAAFKNKFDKALDPATGTLNTKKAFDTFNQLPDKEIAYLFPTKAEQSAAKSGLATLEQINRKNNFVNLDDQALNKAINEISSTAGAVYGAKGRYTTKLALDVVQSLLGRPQAVEQAAFLSFTPDGRALARAALSNKLDLNSIPKGSLEKYIQLSPFGRKVAVPVAASGIATQHQVTPETEIDLNAYEQEAKRRGLIP